MVKRDNSLLTVDFEIRLPAGDIPTGKRDFGKFAFTSHKQNTEVMTRLTLTLKGAMIHPIEANAHHPSLMIQSRINCISGNSI